MVQRRPVTAGGLKDLISGSTLAVSNFLFVSGKAAASCLAMPVNSAVAWSNPTPCLRRPSTAGVFPWALRSFLSVGGYSL